MSNPGEDEIFRAVQTGPQGPLASCTIGTGCFLGIKRPKRGADQPSPLQAGRSLNGLFFYTAKANG